MWGPFGFISELLDRERSGGIAVSRLSPERIKTAKEARDPCG